MYSHSDLILNQQGKVYHLDLAPDQLADTVITVGDPSRVGQISSYFDHLEYQQQHREFVVHTGRLGKQRITVLSTGMGTDNIDIVFNELDALANIDLATRTPKATLRPLNIIRVGTCGALQAQTPLDAFVLTQTSIGFDNLLHFYQHALTQEGQAMQYALDATFPTMRCYVAPGDTGLIDQFAEHALQGMTATMPGFYGPQGRLLRLPLANPNLMAELTAFHYHGNHVLSFDMETSGIYGLGALLGHRCCSIAVVVAQRAHAQFTSSVDGAVKRLIEYVLDRI